MIALLTTQFKEIVLSVYLYNEWRGYTQLEDILIPQLQRYSIKYKHSFIAAVKKHAKDEKKHYVIFKNYFFSQGRKPFQVWKSVGYFDLLSNWVFGKNKELILKRHAFKSLCHIIITTETRGLKQINSMLRWNSIRKDRVLNNIFQLLQKDEPSHFNPYNEWLEQNGYKVQQLS